ncbi:MAG: hypothetical protein R3F43_12100 [bacterium]
MLVNLVENALNALDGRPGHLTLGVAPTAGACGSPCATTARACRRPPGPALRAGVTTRAGQWPRPHRRPRHRPPAWGRPEPLTAPRAAAPSPGAPPRPA